MALLERLKGSSDENLKKIPIYKFWGCVVEITYEELTIEQVKAEFEMDVDEQAEFDWLISKYRASTNPPAFIESMLAIFMLAESGMTGYSTVGELVVRINRIL